VVNFEAKLKVSGVLNEAAVKRIDDVILAEVEQAIKFAIESPLPAPEDAMEDIYSA
jgi:pyruvate dehydrogenase E1 component alpha subunit